MRLVMDCRRRCATASARVILTSIVCVEGPSCGAIEKSLGFSLVGVRCMLNQRVFQRWTRVRVSEGIQETRSFGESGSMCGSSRACEVAQLRAGGVSGCITRRVFRLKSVSREVLFGWRLASAWLQLNITIDVQGIDITWCSRPWFHQHALSMPSIQIPTFLTPLAPRSHTPHTRSSVHRRWSQHFGPSRT